jgi:hypothetical protein
MEKVLSEDEEMIKFLIKTRFIEEKLNVVLAHIETLPMALSLLMHIVPNTSHSYFLSLQFNIFLTEIIFEYLKNQEDGLIYYIDDDNVMRILKIYSLLVKSSPSILRTLLEIKFFELIGCIVSEEVAMLYESIFLFTEDKPTGYNHVCNRMNMNLPIHEIQRRQFEPEIVFKEKKLLAQEKYRSRYKGGIARKKIIEIIAGGNIYYLIENNAVGNIIHFLNCFFSFKPSLGGSLTRGESSSSLSDLDDRKKPEFGCNINSLYSDPKIRDIQTLVVSRTSIEVLKVYKHILKNAIDGLIVRKMIRDEDALDKIYKSIASKDVELARESVLIISIICKKMQAENDISFYCKKERFVNDKELKREDIFRKVGTEKNVRMIFEVLKYECCGAKGDIGVNNYPRKLCEEKVEILQLMNDLYETGRKECFYKISHLMILKSIKDGFSCDEGTIRFINEYYRDILFYLSKNPYNYGRILFSYEERKRTTTHDRKETILDEDNEGRAYPDGKNKVILGEERFDIDREEYTG